MKDVLNDFKSCGRPMNKNELKIKQLEEKYDKVLKDTEELYKMAKEQDSENVNLIDRLENILKTLKGE